MKLVVGSTSFIKKEACVLALRRVGLQLPLISISASSGVNEQPYGLMETLRGAYSRALVALIKCPDATIGVGIENGLFGHEGGTADRPVCVLLVRGDDTPEQWRYSSSVGAAVMMPAEAVRLARKRGFATTTAGQVLHELNPQIIADNPHLALTGRSRIDYLADTLQQVIVTLQLQGSLPPSPALRTTAYGLG
jgi:non-canonical (house-cleaning) NTP pyrophosphatase